MAHVFTSGIGALANRAEARRLAVIVQAELVASCCAHRLCFPQDWPADSPATARAEAAAACMGYDRDLIERFQEAAGIGADGNYGPETRGALRAYGVPNPYPSLYGAGETAYSRPRGWLWALAAAAVVGGGYLYWRR
jgi:hypothetical protein